MTAITPGQGHSGLAQSADTHAAASVCCLIAHDSFDVTLPQLLKRQGPSEAIRCATSAKATLIDDPTNGS